MRIINVVGARPNFMKIAPIARAYSAYPEIESMIVHTGQHYDHAMSRLFFEELDIPRPDVNLEVGSASHAVQTADIMKRFEKVCIDNEPDMVVVVGDVNSTVACGLVAVKMGIGLAHVEAGLRSFDRSMPEEINRRVTDAISDLLFASEESGRKNLLREGTDPDKVFLVGNVMIDTLLANKEKAASSRVLQELGLEERRYAVLTLHRPSNVDDPGVLSGILDALERISRDIEIVFPIHPRTRNKLAEFGLAHRVEGIRGLVLVDPLGYLDFLKLTSNAKVILTDSGGIQEEATILKVPCITLRENTERPVTCEVGCNRLAGTHPRDIVDAFHDALGIVPSQIEVPLLWDGQAAKRIASILAGRARKT